MEYEQISDKRQQAAVLGEMAVYYATALQVVFAGGRGDMDVSAFVGNYNAARSCHRRLLGIGTNGAEEPDRVERAARHMMDELSAEALRRLKEVGQARGYDLVMPDGFAMPEEVGVVEADAEHLAVLGDLAGWAALCGIERFALGQRAEDRDRISRFASNYIKAARVGEALNVRLNRDGVPADGNVWSVASIILGGCEAARCDLEARGAFKNDEVELSGQ